VWLRDVDEDALEAARDRIASVLDGAVERGIVTDDERTEALARVETTTDLGAAVEDAHLVVEAVPEDEALKRDVHETAADLAPAGATLATNTSSLSVTGLAAALDRPERFVGLHFFNPPYAMDLVEVVRGERTADTTEGFAVDFVEGLGKEPVVVDDTPGFATSRLGVALGAEAMRMVEQGVGGRRRRRPGDGARLQPPDGAARTHRRRGAGRPAGGARVPPRGARRAVPPAADPPAEGPGGEARQEVRRGVLLWENASRFREDG
jgi:3-hydroxyacyl-CoA dehydrogenase